MISKQVLPVLLIACLVNVWSFHCGAADPPPVLDGSFEAPHHPAQVFSGFAPGRSVGFTTNVFSATEYDGVAIITLERRGDTSGTISVHYLASDDTARAGLNYVAATGILTF